MKVGDTIWEFDENHRVYREGSSAPIYRCHWRPVTITGETSRSWIIARRPVKKVPKRGDHPGFAFTQEEVDAACWADENRYAIVRLVERSDGKTLRRVAEVVGYKDSRGK